MSTLQADRRRVPDRTAMTQRGRRYRRRPRYRLPSRSRVSADRAARRVGAMRHILGNQRAIAGVSRAGALVYLGVIVVPVGVVARLLLLQGGACDRASRSSGLHNFKHLWTDPTVRQALLFTLKYAVVLSICQICSGYLLALLYLFVLRKLSTFIRTLVFFPVVLPDGRGEPAVQQALRGRAAGRPGQLACCTWLGIAASRLVRHRARRVRRHHRHGPLAVAGFYAVLLYAGLRRDPGGRASSRHGSTARAVCDWSGTSSCRCRCRSSSRRSSSASTRT